MDPLIPLRQQLRKQARQARRRLSAAEQRSASYNLCRRIRTQPAFIRSKHIALYLPNDGEIDPTPLVSYIWAQKKSCYLPVLEPFTNKLRFAPYTADSEMQPNRFGIPEPALKPGQMRNAETLCLILMPLVAFDTQGGRLGMGGGFYDRTLAFKHTPNRRFQAPKLLGLAHDCQELEQVPLEPWDIPLDAIATGSRLLVAEHNHCARKRDFHC